MKEPPTMTLFLMRKQSSEFKVDASTHALWKKANGRLNERICLHNPMAPPAVVIAL